MPCQAIKEPRLCVEQGVVQGGWAVMIQFHWSNVDRFSALTRVEAEAEASYGAARGAVWGSA